MPASATHGCSGSQPTRSRSGVAVVVVCGGALVARRRDRRPAGRDPNEQHRVDEHKPKIAYRALQKSTGRRAPT